jgi:signal transduction histidine kinase
LQDESWFNSKVIAISFFLGCTGWLIKAVLDSLILYNKPFLDILILDVPLTEMFIRFVVSICFFTFGIFLYKNIFQRKKAEKELKKTHNALSKANEEIKERNEDLEKKIRERTEKIEKLLKEKDDLIVQLGHDLKTPLTPLMGLLPLISDKVKDPELKELMEISIKNVHYIRDIVSKTIDITRLDSGLVEFNFEDTNLLLEVERVIKNNQYIFDNNEIYVENNVDDKIVVKADKLRLREVLDNIISNAVKYTSRNGNSITIDAKQKDEYIIVSIEDKGIGLTKEHLDHIFD